MKTEKTLLKITEWKIMFSFSPKNLCLWKTNAEQFRNFDFMRRKKKYLQCLTIVADKYEMRFTWRIEPVSIRIHENTQFIPINVVRFMIPVAEISLSFLIEIIVFQWPSPAVHIIILSNPGWTIVTPINCVNQHVHFLHVINGGQISVILSAVSLSFSPGQRLIHKVILTGWCWCCHGVQGVQHKKLYEHHMWHICALTY